MLPVPVPAPRVVDAAGTADVLVVDGKPEYHESGCSRLAGESTVSIPLSQALADGFTACSTCSPPTGPAAPEASTAESAEPAAQNGAPARQADGDSAPAGPSQVWVVDGRPEFHVRACRTIQDVEVVEVPLHQALDDGFTECSVCRPTSGGAGAAPDDSGPETGIPAADSTAGSTSGSAPEASGAAAGGRAAVLTKAAPEIDARQVWVADGFPEFHIEGCEELAGLTSVAVPYEQAIEDGFQPCVVCNPDGLPPATAAAAASAPPAAGGELIEVWVVDGKPEYHQPDCERLQGEDGVAVPYEQAVGDGFSACSACRPDAASTARPDHGLPASAASGDTVQVVDGFPYYHRRDCSVVADLPAVTVPRGQAVEDGFTPCAACLPDTEPAPEPQPNGAATATASRTDRQVWVVDGHPDYHVETCVELERLGGGEPIPMDQAAEDGFSACSVCRPDVAPSAEGGAHIAVAADIATDGSDQAASSPQVWVVDGFPDYHLQGCPRLDGLDEEPVPYEQAVEDGFTPCSVCAADAGEGSGTAGEATSAVYGSEPESAATAEAAGGDVLVADGHPDYHRPGCSQLEGLDEEPVPYEQAVEDGFTPCRICRPEESSRPGEPPALITGFESPAQAEFGDESRTEAPSEPEPEPRDEAQAEAPSEPEPEPEPEDKSRTEAPSEPEPEAQDEAQAEAPPELEPQPELAAAEGPQVFVVDGRPRYHSEDCLIIKGHSAVAMPKPAAEADGFLPCSLCQR